METIKNLIKNYAEEGFSALNNKELKEINSFISSNSLLEEVTLPENDFSYYTIKLKEV